MRSTATPLVKDVVLVGGGHAHVAVLKQFGMRPVEGIRLTLVTDVVDTPYSGMLPGYLAGRYTADQAHIPLRPLARFANADLIHAKAVGMDLEEHRIHLSDRPPIRYDWVSIDIGSSPSRTGVPGADRFALPVKPIPRFQRGWQDIETRIASSRPDQPFRILVTGGGAGGVELLLSLRHRLLKGLRVSDTHFTLGLITASETILPTHNRQVQRRFRRVLRQAKVDVITGDPVCRVRASSLDTESGRRLGYDALIWVTDAAPQKWPQESGLATDAKGFIAVHPTLQSVSHPQVFAAGDVAHVAAHPRPKSGVFAVRQGRPLYENLVRAAVGKPLESYRPQRQFLSLISTGSPYAVASRGPFAAEGAWVWRWKDWIDRRWMAQYRELPDMTQDASLRKRVRRTTVLPAAARAIPRVMRCGGCAAKVEADVLHRVFQRLHIRRDSNVALGLDRPDDAAITKSVASAHTVQTTDFFTQHLNDPYLFAKIAVLHALNDLHAMGAQPRHALALATLPPSAPEISEELLFQLLSGAVEALETENATLIGGHTAEMAELAFGLTALGSLESKAPWRKSRIRPGDRWILTKGLGTGVIMAADMRGAAPSGSVDAAQASMLLSNRLAVDLLQQHQARACTDISGFGLIGHLWEMLRHGRLSADISLMAVPAIDGALATIEAGILSTSHGKNRKVRSSIQFTEGARGCREELLYDPQTSGPLLAAVPARQANACVESLRSSGYPAAAILGQTLCDKRPAPGIHILP